MAMRASVWKERRQPNSFWMIKLNYSVHFVTVQFGRVQGQLELKQLFFLF